MKHTNMLFGIARMEGADSDDNQQRHYHAFRPWGAIVRDCSLANSWVYDGNLESTAAVLRTTSINRHHHKP